MADSATESLPSAGEIKFLIHHIFLPPKLPQEDDYDPHLDDALLRVVKAALDKFQKAIAPHAQVEPAIIGVVKAAKAISALRKLSGPSGGVEEANLAEALEYVRDNQNTVLPIYVRAQNAGIIIQNDAGQISFEAFELSPLNQAVMSTKGRLRRSFPGPLLAVEPKDFSDPEFLSALAQVLAKMSYQSAPGMQPTARKAGQDHKEDRDTTHPGLVTELVTGFLRPFSRPIDTPKIWKNTRDEVLWRNCLLPWRRSPLWLLVRVVIQLLLVHSSPPGASDLAVKGEGRLHYKIFMVFLMSEVLRMSLVLKSLPHPDLIFCMIAKISRRLLKLTPSQSDPKVETMTCLVNQTLRKAHEKLQGQWSGAMAQHDRVLDFGPLSSLDFGRDVPIALPELDDFIRRIPSRTLANDATHFQPKVQLEMYQASALPEISSSSSDDYSYYNLAACESWIIQHLARWRMNHCSDDNTCESLRGLMVSYHTAASDRYSGNPESKSRMILAVLELWMACDESAIFHSPLLQEYNPEVPLELLKLLLLPLKSEMARLSRVEEYIECRRAQATNQKSIFCDFGSEQCYAVRYFNTSQRHKDLMEEISDAAQKARNDKIAEIHAKKERYAELSHLYNNSTCDTKEEWDQDRRCYVTRHSTACQRCSKKAEMDLISIDMHEWPLPHATCQAKSVVFELEAPPSFSAWRAATMFLLLDVLRLEYDAPRKIRAGTQGYALQRYEGLSQYHQPTPAHVGGKSVWLLSEDKPNTRTHRKRQKITDATETSVCVNNGLHYQYFDPCHNSFVDTFSATDVMLEMCTYTLPAAACSLQGFLLRTFDDALDKTPNSVIASQSECPGHMSVAEYRSLAAIPIGYRLQWQNILTQLACPSVDFRKLETSLFAFQTIYHKLDPKSPTAVAGHVVLEDEAFCLALFDRIEEAAGRVKENWESIHALNAFVSIATRALSLSAGSEHCKQRGLEVLGVLRDVAFVWTRRLGSKCDEAYDDVQRAEFLGKAVDVALVCCGTFDVGEEHIGDILCQSENASAFVQCAIMIQECSPRDAVSASSGLLAIMRQRWHQLPYLAYPILRNQALAAGGDGIYLDEAISKAWPAYRRANGSQWQIASPKTGYWLTSRSQSGQGGELVVHYNLLTGELLVNGLPLARLPSDYERHGSYSLLFGRFTFRVVPFGESGMRFSSKQSYQGHSLNFGLDSSDLLVRAESQADQVLLDLVPSHVFRDKLPTAFVDDYIHWYNMRIGTVEFRPIAQPWTSPSELTWTLKRAGSSGWALGHKEDRLLVNPASKTGKELASVLSPLRPSLLIHLLFHPDSRTLDIDLPGLQLGFKLVQGESIIRSRQFRGLVIDKHQNAGTLVGLATKLVLEDPSGEKDRIIIVPSGQADCLRSDNHTSVTISIAPVPTLTMVHAYKLDETLGRLVDNGSLQSKLFLAYMHALTSFCLPDPFTENTGTEQALSILSSAAVRSFETLSQDNLNVLADLAALTPSRRYYPPDHQVMEDIQWSSSLGFLAQHGRFREIVASLFAQSHSTKMLHPESLILPKLADPSQLLLWRASSRTSMFRISGFGAEEYLCPDKRDVVYNARDRGLTTARAQRSLEAATLVFRRSSGLPAEPDKTLGRHLWNFFSAESGVVVGLNDLLPSDTFHYDSKWLMDEDWKEHLAELWFRIHARLNYSVTDSGFSKFRFMMWLATMAFPPGADMEVIRTIAAIYAVPSLGKELPPAVARFELSSGCEAERRWLQRQARSYYVGFRDCPESQLSAQVKESSLDARYRRERTWQSNRDRAINSFLDHLCGQELSEQPTMLPLERMTEIRRYLRVEDVMKAIRPRFGSWFNNHCFKRYLESVSKILGCQRIEPLGTLGAGFEVNDKHKPSSDTKGSRFVTVGNIFDSAPPSFLPEDSKKPSFDMLECMQTNTNRSTSPPRLSALIDDLNGRAQTEYESKYAEELQDSLAKLRVTFQEHTLSICDTELHLSLRNYLSRCRNHVKRLFDDIVLAIHQGASDHIEFTLLVSHAPRLSPIFLLQQLGRSRWGTLPDGWKKVIIRYGVALTALQQAQRLVQAVNSSRNDLIKELHNPGHGNWDPFDSPESLLLEVESGIMIRDVQEEIARQMREPPLKRNAVMQLNMGEGKSSVIVPIVATALVDGSALVRVVVAKPQSKQMYRMLSSKLGGLIDRQIFHMPFSRSLRLDYRDVETLRAMCQRCIDEGDIMLVQPEHILSFKLMGLECLAAGKDEVGRSLLRTQRFLDETTRDIVDESDENFSAKFELVYTMGPQKPIDFAPERWTVMQAVLELVRQFAPSIKDQMAQAIEISDGCAGSFPRLRLLKQSAESALFERIANYICETGLPGLPVARQNPSVRKAVFVYLTKRDLDTDDITRIEEGPFWIETTANSLLLLRGLLAGGVLGFVLGQKRWRVNYGLDDTRWPPTKLAVPYRAKDSPTPRSEFSHPDVTIALTCLSYYYGGLNDDDLFLAFRVLIGSDQADVEYQEWLADAPTLPLAFRQLQGVNLKDMTQCKAEVFGPFRFAKSVIDYFLSRIVFAKHAKEFPQKLSASGWDLGAPKPHPTTGFSGTIDSREVLPLDVAYLDLPEQKHTNALVLEHLLRPENTVFHLPERNQAPDDDGSRPTDAEALLTNVVSMQPPVRVILDVGAQILELTNFQVAEKWLVMMKHDDQVQAAIFFDDKENMQVLDRKGRIEPFHISSFADQLDQCLVFLDESHTRGTDLKLPENYRAAVTLGANLTKDRLVQACMRMRKLGKGQSVVFCLSEEIRTKIRERRRGPGQKGQMDGDQAISVADVLSWAIGETHADLRRSMPLWAVQGKRFDRQDALWSSIGRNGEMSAAHAQRFLESEAQTLNEKYRPRRAAAMAAGSQVEGGVDISGDEGSSDEEGSSGEEGGTSESGSQESSGTEVDTNMADVVDEGSDRPKQIRDRCRQVGSTSFDSAALQEEQERELSPEVEQERQVERPPPATPRKLILHADVRTFVESGVLRRTSSAFLPAFSILGCTSAAAHLNPDQFPDTLLATADFEHTIETSASDKANRSLLDAFQRPVQWILTNRLATATAPATMVIISPFEAQELLPLIKKSGKVTLHTYAPRPNLEIHPLDELELYTTPALPDGWQRPPWALIELLNLFAGQLYFDSFSEYQSLCKALGLSWEAAREGVEVAADGFVLSRRATGGGVVAVCTFKKSPVAFLKAFLTRVRRDGQAIGKTHVGRMLNGELLTEDDFEERGRSRCDVC